MTDKHVDENAVARKLSEAGFRDTPTSEATARVRAQAEMVWRDSIAARRSRQRRLVGYAIAAAAVLVIAIGAGLWTRGRTTPDAGPAPLILAAVTGDASAIGPETKDPRPLRRDDRLTVGDNIRTGDAPAGLRLSTGRRLRLAADTSIHVLANDRVELLTGTLYVASGSSDLRDTAWTVTTHLGDVTEVGTQYEVARAGETLTLQTRQGQIAFKGRSGVEQVPAGRALRIDRDGTRHRSAVADDAWAWSDRLALTPDIDSWTAAAFLDWVAAERGWRLAYATADARRHAETATLRGTTAGLGVDDALETLLPAAGLAHRRDGNDLVVWID